MHRPKSGFPCYASLRLPSQYQPHVTDPLEITNRVQQTGNLAAVLLRQAVRRKFYEIRTQTVFIYVDAGLGFPHSIIDLCVKVSDQRQRLIHGTLGLFCHFDGQLAALLDCNRRGDHQALVQQLELCPLSLHP